jgi:predicted aspartyl protease
MLCVLALLSFLRSAGVESSTSLKSDQLFAAPTQVDRIGRIVAPVMINGKGPFRLVVDTGASHSTISPALAELLGLQTENEPGMWVNGITGTALLPSVPIERLEVGKVVLENSRLPVVWGSVMSNTDGILGVASLKTERLFVDFKWNRVSIVEGGHRAAPAGFQRIPFRRLQDGLLVVPATVGGVQVNAVIDTGAQRTLGNLALREALSTDRGAGKLLLVTNVYGATTESKSGEVHVVPAVELSSVTLKKVAVVYGDFHIFDVWNMREEPAMIIGMDVLGSFRALAIDFARSELYLKSVNYDADQHTGRGIGIRAHRSMVTREPRD